MFERICMVQFKNGKYAVRKGLFLYLYKTLTFNNYWWSGDCDCFKNCIGDYKVFISLLIVLIINISLELIALFS